MLLITKGPFWEPTMFMKTNHLTRLSHDLYENTGLSRFSRNSKRQGFRRGFSRPANTASRHPLPKTVLSQAKFFVKIWGIPGMLLKTKDRK
jgi:hypothetical protein